MMEKSVPPAAPPRVERLAATRAEAVTSVVDGQHVEAVTQLGKRREPVERGVRRPPVQKHQGGCAGRPLDLAHERGAAPGQVDEPPVGDARRSGQG